MRFTLLATSAALAASLVLSACSSGGSSSAIPSGESSMGRHVALKIVSATVMHDTGCGSQWYECVTVSKASPFTQEWCISSTGSCNTPYPGTWTWSLPITTLKGKPFKKLKSSWDPNPGNPSELTIAVKGKKIKNSHGKVKYEGNLSACSPTYGCVYGPAPIGIETI